MDFTLKRYRELLEALQTGGGQFVVDGAQCTMHNGVDGGQSFDKLRTSSTMHNGGDVNRASCIVNRQPKKVFLRHDVDLRPERSLATARIEAELGIKATYYFRAVPESWDEKIIMEIARLGHAIGYHYESLTTCNGDVDKAYEDFCRILESLRELVPVNTICMHGSPRSPWDSKDIWKKYDYHKLGIDFEPYIDTDWSQVLYLTDTGRRWDGYKVSVRDKIPHWQDEWNKCGWSYRTTNQIISSIHHSNIPSLNLMITTHPQRWTDDKMAWLKEFVLQNIKNIVKRMIILLK